MSVVSSLNYSDSRGLGSLRIPTPTPQKPRSSVQDICKTIMAEDQPGWLLPAVEARRLGKCSFWPRRKEHLQMANAFQTSLLLPLATRLLSGAVMGYNRLASPRMMCYARAACTPALLPRPLRIAAVLFQPATAQLPLKHAHRASASC